MYTVTPKERKMRRYMLMFSILFLFFAFKCSSQIVSLNPMRFSCGKSDTVFIYISTDSLNQSQLFVQCSRHQHKTWVGITIGFVDGDILELKAYDCYNIKDISKLSSIKFDYISFDEFLSSTACINVKTKDYFIRFFNPDN